MNILKINIKINIKASKSNCKNSTVMKAVIPNTIDAPPKATYFAGFQMNLLVRFDEELLVELEFELVDWNLLL